MCQHFCAAVTSIQGHVASFDAELNLLLALMVYSLSIWRGQATPGSDLMNLRYRNDRAMNKAAAVAAAQAQTVSAAAQQTAAASTAAVAAAGQGVSSGQDQPAAGTAVEQVHPPWLHGGRTGIEGPGLSQQQKLGYALGFVLMPYLWIRINRHAVHANWGQQLDDRLGSTLWRLLRGADAAHKLGMLLNLWVFLYEGKYRWAGGWSNRRHPLALLQYAGKCMSWY
eukprot:GHRR01030248.1.p1 GENE.GHRR01030248.1~~GHRR01030248.1.p1  ORF type:complete len:225 (+),score=101.01 GHRR01030248.1:775-1449(+)